MKQRLLKTIGLALLCVVGASNAWAEDTFSPVLDVNFRTNSSNNGWESEWPKSAVSEGVTWMQLKSTAGQFALQKYTVSDLKHATQLVLTLTVGSWSGVDAVKLWAFPNTDWTASSDCSTLYPIVKQVLGVDLRSTAGTPNSPLVSGAKVAESNPAKATFTITGDALAKIKGTATADGTFTIMLTNDNLINSGNQRSYLSDNTSNAEGNRPILTLSTTETDANLPVVKKDTEMRFANLNQAFTGLTYTDADVELEVNADQTLTARCTWSTAHTLTITPKQDITITANNNNYMWFLVNTDNTSSVLKIGSDDYKITLDGDDSKTYDVFITKKERKSSLYLKNIEFKEFNLNNAGNICGMNNYGEGVIELEDIIINSCSNPSTAFIYNAGTSNDQVRLKGNLDITSSTGTSIYTAKRIKIGDTDAIYNDFAVPGSNITINWGGETTTGSGPVVIKTPGTVFGGSGVKFELTNEDCGLFRITGNGDLKVTAAYTLTVDEAGAATLCLPFDATIQSEATAYNLSYTSGDNINAASVEAITANQAVLVTADAGSYKFTPKPSWGSELKTSGQTSANDVLIGNYAADYVVPATSGEEPNVKTNYILSYKDSQLGFRKVDGSTNKVQPYRAYMSVKYSDGGVSSAPAFFSLDLNGMNGTTGISIASREETTRNNDGAVYNLNGVRMNGENLPKGIYVKNGRKFVVK